MEVKVIAEGVGPRIGTVAVGIPAGVENMVDEEEGLAKVVEVGMVVVVVVVVAEVVEEVAVVEDRLRGIALPSNGP